MLISKFVKKWFIAIVLFLLLFQPSALFAQVVEIYDEDESLWYPLENKKSLFYVNDASNYSFGLRDEISSVMQNLGEPLQITEKLTFPGYRDDHITVIIDYPDFEIQYSYEKNQNHPRTISYIKLKTDKVSISEKNANASDDGYYAEYLFDYKTKLCIDAQLGILNEERNPTVRAEAYLNNYFDGKQYFCEKYLFGDDEMTFAFCPNKEDEKIFQSAILFQSEEDKIIPRLFFYGGRINNAYPNEMLVNMKSSTKDFYGLSIHHVNGYNTFSINCYWKQGKDVADPILVEWKNNRFRKYKIDEEIL